jgi:hypothetical protein
MERYATDSFQNILFPLLLFPVFVNAISKSRPPGPPLQQLLVYPDHLTIVSHAFKRHRFMALHLPGLRYPVASDRLKYIGLDPPMTESRRAEVEAGELCRAVKAWEHDLYGVGKVLMEKRRARGWTMEREQMGLREMMQAAEISKDRDVMAFIKWLHSRTEEGGHYPDILLWTGSVITPRSLIDYEN